MVVVAALSVGLVGLAGCGVPEEGRANRIQEADVPFGLLDEQSTTTVARSGRPVQVYLFSDDRLAAVDRTLPDDGGLVQLVELVIAGPNELERAIGATSSVPVGTVSSVGESRGIAQVDLAESFGDIRSGDQLVALGQLVYTLTGQPGIGGVEFSLDGDPIEVPLGDGTFSDAPLSRDDFAALAPR